jgi:hypothetical protein
VSCRSAWAIALLLAGCDLGEEGIPEGKLATVGESVFGPEDVAEVHAQLGAYAQLRFVGGEGRQHLLEALVDAELLAQEAIEHGLGDDPRVRWAVLEEIATVYESAELERRVPLESVAADADALRAWYEDHRDAFTLPEQRSLEGVVFQSFAEAEAALAELREGRAELAEKGEIFGTKLRARDDDEYPALDPFLFDPAIGEGEFLRHPVFIGESIMVGRVQLVRPETTPPLSDSDVRARVVQAVRAERIAAAREQLRAELRERWPERPLSPKGVEEL